MKRKILKYKYLDTKITASQQEQIFFMDFKFSLGFVDYVNKVEYAAIELHQVQKFKKVVKH